MAINVVAVMQFQAGDYHWSERLYQVQAKDMKQSLKDADALASERSKLLGQGASIKLVRVSNEQVRGDALHKFSDTWGSKQFANDPTDVPWTGFMCILEGADGLYRRPLVIRGLPDKLITEPDDAAGNAAPRNKALNAYIAYLVVNSWCIKAISKDPAKTQEKAIKDVTRGAAPDQFLTLNVPGHGFVKGDVVYVSGIQSLPKQRIQGYYQAFPVDADNILIRRSATGTTYTYIGGGKISKKVIDYVPISGGTPERNSKRNTATGSVFAVRGARKRAKTT